MHVNQKGERMPYRLFTPARLETGRAYPLVVFLHGLMETEAAWGLGRRPTYGARLADDLGATEVK